MQPLPSRRHCERASSSTVRSTCLSSYTTMSWRKKYTTRDVLLSKPDLSNGQRRPGTRISTSRKCAEFSLNATCGGLRLSFGSFIIFKIPIGEHTPRRIGALVPVLCDSGWASRGLLSDYAKVIKKDLWLSVISGSQ